MKDNNSLEKMGLSSCCGGSTCLFNMIPTLITMMPMLIRMMMRFGMIMMISGSG